MARLAVRRGDEVGREREREQEKESEDEEFPDLEEVLKGSLGGRVKLTTGKYEDTGKSERAATVHAISRNRGLALEKMQGGSRNTKVQRRGISNERAGKGNQVVQNEKIQEKSRRKMRVLASTTENPLLRPIVRSEGKVGSRDSMGKKVGVGLDSRRGKEVVTGQMGEKGEVKVDRPHVLKTREPPMRTEPTEEECTASELRETCHGQEAAFNKPSVSKPANQSKQKSSSKKMPSHRGEPCARDAQERASDALPIWTASTESRPKTSKTKNQEAQAQRSIPKITDYEQESFTEQPTRQPSRQPRQKVSLKRTPSPQPQPQTEDSEEGLELESEGLSDFIVNDSSDFEGGESIVIEKPVPRSVRRLVRGRRRVVEDSDSDEDLELKMGQLKVGGDVSSEGEGEPSGAVKKRAIDRSKDENPPPHGSSRPGSKEAKDAKENLRREIQEMEDPFTLTYSPSEIKPCKISFATPPGSPSLKPSGLRSPQKIPRIPLTPHRPSMDTFWQQDIINAWNDEFSPKKTPKPTAKIDVTEDDSTNELAWSPRKKIPKKQDRSKLADKKAFSQQKEALAQAFLLELDNTITSGQVSRFASSTGGIKIIWSKKLNSTAGRAHWKSVRPNPTSSTTLDTSIPIHHASIELASKIISDEHRLYNTLAHEFCHLATFMISKQTKNPHGKEFKSWGAKCARQFGHRGVEVTTKHTYEIEYRFVWECENCGVLFKRHSRSVDPARHRCGTCKGVLVQVRPLAPKTKAKAGVEGRGDRGDGKKVLGEYQAFVRDNLRKVREEIVPGSPHKEVMVEVGRRYRVYKASKVGGVGGASDEVGGGTKKSVVGGSSREGSIESLDGVREGSIESLDVTPVARKLDFLDLTSP